MTTITASTTGRRRSRSRSASQTANPRTFRPLPLLVLLLSLPLIVLGTRLLLAGIASYQAQAFLDDWHSKGQQPSARAWQIAHAAAQRAVELHPGSSGEYLERLGRIQQWQHAGQPFGAARAEASRRAALASFRAASEARPTWPYIWTSLAYAKLSLHEFDDEFAHALQQAHALGPTRDAINRSLTETGLLAWQNLDVNQRNLSLEVARRTVTHSTKEAQYVHSLAVRVGAADQLCQRLKATTRQRAGICQ